ncbi:DUF6868 family protein [uncultured Zhongshania sp.]|jgi:hypothetical protein|uniref:DUF6868 family protein n=1 Tax=Zhongshania sp. TaxID=1971902 RepID=UPI00345AE04B|tara:strand:+ start:6055 stop:6300 length:246 start_codon:yes stop_codon:yes gene_type:complete
MDIVLVTSFLKWCCIINFSALLFSSLAFSLMPGFIYRVHGQLFKLSQDDFNTTIYQFLALYKVLILVFNFVPFLALWIVQS